MAVSKITNDKHVSIRIANFLIDAAGQLRHEKPETPAQEDENDFAELILDWANEHRERFGKDALPMPPKRAENGSSVPEFG